MAEIDTVGWPKFFTGARLEDEEGDNAQNAGPNPVHLKPEHPKQQQRRKARLQAELRASGKG